MKRTDSINNANRKFSNTILQGDPCYDWFTTAIQFIRNLCSKLRPCDGQTVYIAQQMHRQEREEGLTAQCRQQCALTSESLKRL